LHGPYRKLDMLSFSSIFLTCSLRYTLLGALLAGYGGFARGQALVTASRIGDIQVGGGFSYAASDYENLNIRGGAFYADFDFRPHFGAEVDFHQLNNSPTQLYERTYEVGGRYLLKRYGAMSPYIKVLYGRGVLNYPYNTGNVAYNMFVGGGGVDVRVKPWLNVRGDFEYQNWLSGPGIANGLTPMIGTVGVAYHFGSDKLNGRRWVLAEPKPERAPKSQTPPPLPPPPPPPAGPPATN
jgi:hypothetical protein